MSKCAKCKKRDAEPCALYCGQCENGEHKPARPRGSGSRSATGYAAELARRLQAVLERAGVSQVELAQKVGVSAMHLNHWIHGRRAPSAHHLAALLHALWWVDARELLCGKRHTHH